MNKKHLKIALLSLMCTSMALSYTACKDYDDDIDNLQGQIDGIKVTLGELQTKIESGSVITDVTSTADGIVITLSDNKKYTLTNGKDGASADIWTIGADGYWYKNNTKTEYKAIGTDGATGATGATGSQGPQGPQGNPGNTIYYYPNPETGMFDKYENGKKVESTDIPWRTNDKSGGMTATLAGTRLTLAGFDPNDPEKTVVINSGVTVGSIAFVPSIVCKDLPYATTDKPFYHIAAYLSEEKYNATTKDFIPQTAWDKSNIVDLIYRVNPTDATVTEDATVEFRSRGVESRSADDFGDASPAILSNIKEKQAYANGKLTVAALYWQTRAIAGKNDIVAARLWQGQDIYTSDYIAVTSEAITPTIVSKTATSLMAKNEKYHTRDKAVLANGSAQTDTFVKGFVSLGDKNNIAFVYNQGTLDLTQFVELYSFAKSKTLSELNFDGIKYKFSMPKDYFSDDAQKTNQQWFAQVTEEGVFSLNTTNLGEGLTAAIGRTPVVRVDAYMDGNAGEAAKQMVASSYIKIGIVDKAPKDPIGDKVLPVLQTPAEYGYSELKSTMQRVKTEGYMPWDKVNTLIYGAEGLTSSNFWGEDTYGANGGTTYTVKVTVKDRNGKEVDPVTGREPVEQVATVGTLFTTSVGGIGTRVLFDKGNTQTSTIEFTIDRLAKTDITYADVNGKGALYTVYITLPSNDRTEHPNLIIKKEIYVKSDFVAFKANPLYDLYPNDPGKVGVWTIGILDDASGLWKMQTSVKEAFEMIAGKDITQYYADKYNVAPTPAIVFALKPNQPDFTYKPYDVALATAMTQPTQLANMDYTVTFYNSETKTEDFDVEFRNPFVAGTPGTIEILGNKIGGDTKQAKPSVIVNSRNEGEAIYKWDATTSSLVLTGLATDTYKLTPALLFPAVTFEFDTTAGNYAQFTSQLAPGSTFGVNKSTGEITFKNLGSGLGVECDAVVVATVTFKDLSVVKVRIPVKVTTKAN